MNKLSLCFLCVYCLSNAYSYETLQSESAAWGKNFNTQSISASKSNNEKIQQTQQFVKTQNPYLGYVSIDYLYWAAKRTGSFYEMNDYVEPSVKGDLSANPVTLKPKWSSGFRLEMGFSNIYDWMISGVYTYYTNRLHHHKPFSDKDVSIFNESYILSSDTNFRLRYWTFDLDFSTLFNFSSSTTLKPFFTFRGGHFRHHTRYYAENFEDLTDPDQNQVINVYLPYTFTGFGPRAGFTSYYKIGKTGLAFFGSLSASLLYGKVKATSFYSKAYTYVTHLNRNSRDYNLHFHDLKANLQLLLGSEWKYFFDRDTKAIMLRINWETNYWWDLSDYYSEAEYFMDRSLILFGANFGIGFEF